MDPLSLLFGFVAGTLFGSVASDAARGQERVAGYGFDDTFGDDDYGGALTRTFKGKVGDVKDFDRQIDKLIEHGALREKVEHLMERRNAAWSKLSPQQKQEVWYRGPHGSAPSSGARSGYGDDDYGSALTRLFKGKIKDLKDFDRQINRISGHGNHPGLQSLLDRRNKLWLSFTPDEKEKAWPGWRNEVRSGTSDGAARTTSTGERVMPG